MANGALITGSVLLNDGSDTSNAAGGTNQSGITMLDGGYDVLLGKGLVDAIFVSFCLINNQPRHFHELAVRIQAPSPYFLGVRNKNLAGC